MRSIFGWMSRTQSPAREPPVDRPPAADAADAWATLRTGSPDTLPAPQPPPPRATLAPPLAPPPPPIAVPRSPPRRRPLPLARTGDLRSVAPLPSIYAGPNVIDTYVETCGIDELGTLPVPHRLRLHPAMRGATPAPLFDEASLPQRIRTLHAAHPDAPVIAIVALPGQELGGAGLLQQYGRVFVDATIMPGYVTQLVRPEALMLPDIWRGSLLSADAEIIETAVPVALAFHPTLVYGHFLLEMLPRLHILGKLRAYGRAFPIAVPTDWPKWAHDFISLYYDESEIIWYHKEHQRVRAPCFIMPTMMHVHYNFHPEMNVAAQGALARALEPTTAPTPSRIYLSRSRHPRGRHGLINELEVEDTLKDLGFTVVHPQSLSFSAQRAM